MTDVGFDALLNALHAHPWNEIAPTLAPPYDTTPVDPLSSIVKAFAQRTPSGATLILNDDFTAISDDPHLRWTNRQYSQHLPELIKLLVKYELASFGPLGASDRGKKVKVRFKFAWWDLVDAIENPKALPSWQPFLTEARTRIRN